MNWIIIIILLIVVIGINGALTAFLITKNNISQKLLRELKTGVQNIINELDTHIALGEDVVNELQILISTANIPVENKNQKNMNSKVSKAHIQPRSNDNSSEDENFLVTKDKKALITLMLEKREDIDTIVTSLDVTYDEVNLIKNKRDKILLQNLKV